jgi:hypothetical protein
VHLLAVISHHIVKVKAQLIYIADWKATAIAFSAPLVSSLQHYAATHSPSLEGNCMGELTIGICTQLLQQYDVKICPDDY